MRYLIDTDILIDHEKGIPPAHQFLQEINTTQNQLFLSVITLTELLAGLSKEEKRKTEPLISCFETIVMDRQIAETAADYLYQYQRKQGVGLGDAVIAATAYHLKSRLITRNRKHYPMTNIHITIPY